MITSSSNSKALFECGKQTYLAPYPNTHSIKAYTTNRPQKLWFYDFQTLNTFAVYLFCSLSFDYYTCLSSLFQGFQCAFIGFFPLAGFSLVLTDDLYVPLFATVSTFLGCAAATTYFFQFLALVLAVLATSVTFPSLVAFTLLCTAGRVCTVEVGALFGCSFLCVGVMESASSMSKAKTSS